MDDISISKYLVETFSNIELIEADGNSFFMYDPDGKLGPSRTFPFATIVTNDAYDNYSDLNRTSVFRFNFGLRKETFHRLFGDGEGYDFTVLDKITPHPIYGNMNWACVLSPSDATFETVKPYIAESFDLAVERHAKLTKG